MAQSLLEMAKELVAAQIQTGDVSPDQMAELLSTTHQTLLSLHETEAPSAQAGIGADETKTPPPNWKTSLTKYSVTCLECGATFRQLSARHLRLHDMDGRSYRDKYGIPRTQSLSARDVLARRREVVQASKPWEKSPNSRKAQKKAAAKTRSTASKKTPTQNTAK